MTDFQLSPGGLYVPPSAADGAYLPHKAGVRFTEYLRLIGGTNTTVTLGTGTVQIDTTGARQLYPLVSTDASGNFGFVWTEDGEPIYLEVPA